MVFFVCVRKEAFDKRFRKRKPQTLQHQVPYLLMNCCIRNVLARTMVLKGCLLCTIDVFRRTKAPRHLCTSLISRRIGGVFVFVLL